jgi:hypothetical protein
MLWVLPLVLAAAGASLLVWLAVRARNEIDPTRRSIALFGGELRPVLLRVRDETAQTRRRYERDAR